MASGNLIENAVGGEEEEEEEEEEEKLFYYVPYIHNGFVLDHLAKHNNTATAEMLFELPLCRHDDQKALSKSVSELKAKRRDLMRRKSKSTEDANIFQRFLDAEFVFPVPSTTQRF